MRTTFTTRVHDRRGLVLHLTVYVLSCCQLSGHEDPYGVTTSGLCSYMSLFLYNIQLLCCVVVSGHSVHTGFDHDIVIIARWDPYGCARGYRSSCWSSSFNLNCWSEYERVGVVKYSGYAVDGDYPSRWSSDKNGSGTVEAAESAYTNTTQSDDDSSTDCSQRTPGTC